MTILFPDLTKLEGVKSVKPPIHSTILTTALVLTLGLCLVSLADDDNHKKWHADEKGFHGKRHNRKDRNEGYKCLKPVTNQTYKETCGACHFTYQPELLPSGSWNKILANLKDHYGETVDLDAEAMNNVTKYLVGNGAEHSKAKLSGKIMQSLGGQTPTRITEVQYIRRKHSEIPSEVLARKSIGSLSNCAACHKTADQGIYNDDNVEIPK